MNMTKKWISLLLALVMVMSLLPFSALAEDAAAAPEAIEETYAPEPEPITEPEPVAEPEPAPEPEPEPVAEPEPEPEPEPAPAPAPEAAPAPAETSAALPAPAAKSVPEEKGTTADNTFITYPQGGTVQPNSSLTLSWSTSFTPTKVEIGYGSSIYSETIVYTLTSSLKQSMSYPLDYGDSATSEYWFIRAYPESGSSVRSNFFSITRGELSFTSVPAGGSVQPEHSITLSWSTNFTPSKVVIGYGSVWDEHPVATLTSGLSRNMSYSLSWDKAAFTTDGYYIRAYYDNNHSKRSEDFTITKVSRKFTQSPPNTTISAGGSATVTWTTNFTITRVEIYARNSDYEYILYKSISGAANSYTFNYAETPPTGYRIRAYYGSGQYDYAISDTFYMTPKSAGFTTQPESEVTILPQSSTTIHWALNFTPVKIELWTNKAGSDAYKKRVATLSASATSYPLYYDEEQDYWLQVYYGSGSNDFYYSNVIHASPTDYMADMVGDYHLYLEPGQSQTVNFTANFSPTRIEVWNENVQGSNLTFVETIASSRRSYTIDYDFDDVVWLYLYYNDASGTEQHKNVVYYVHHTVDRAFTTQPPTNVTAPYGGTVAVQWNTNFQPTRIEVIRSWWEYQTGSVEEVIKSLSGSATSCTLPKGEIYYIRAYYMTKTGEGHLDSVGIYVQGEAPVFRTQPTGGTINPDSSLAISWVTNFVPTKIQIGFKTSSGIWNTRAEITTGLYKSMSYSLPYVTAIHGDMQIRAFYDSGSSDYVESSAFNINKPARQFTTQPSGGNIYPWTTKQLSWTTNFVPVKVQIGYRTQRNDGSWLFVSKAELTTNLKKSMNYTLDYDTAVNSANWQIRAYYGTGTSDYVTSDAFTVNKLEAYVCGDDLTAVLGSDGTLTFSGTGDMYDYSTNNLPPWYSVRASIKEVVIPGGVTKIGRYAFWNCGSLNTVTIPPSVTQVGSYAFQLCGSLRWANYDGFKSQWDDIDFGTQNDKLLNASMSFLVRTGTLNGTDIRWGIYGDQNLLEIDGWGEIPGYMQMPWYEYGEYIETVKIWHGIEKIGGENFRGCTAMRTVYLPDTLTYVDDAAFLDCKELDDVYYDGMQAEWEEITILPYNEPLLGANLHTVAHEEALTDDLSWSVDDTGLLRIWVDDSLMGSGDECYIPNYSTSDRPPWFEDYADMITAVRVEDGVTSIGRLAFAGLTNLRTVELADSVTGVGVSAFANCSSLTDIELSDSITRVSTSAFYNCTSLTQIRLPANALIWQNTFNGCSKLEKVWLPENATSIPEGFFNRCTKLKEVHIPGTVTSIDKNAFSGCNALKTGDVYFDGTSAQWAAIDVDTTTTGNNNLLNAGNIHFNPEELRVDAVNFPDAQFRAYVADNFDTDGSGWLTDAEIAAADYIDDEDNDYTSLQGIEYFPNLTGILIDAAPSLTSVDLTANTELISVDFSDCGNLEEIDLEGLYDLIYLYLSGNALTELDLTGLSSLQVLSVSGNPLTELDVSDLTLKELYCHSMPLSGLDLSGQTALFRLYCYGSGIKELDITGCPLLCEIIRDGTRTEKTLDGVPYVEYKLGNTNHVLAVDPDCIVYTEDSGIRIDAAHFPDPVFRQHVYVSFDTDRSGCLSYEEIEAVGSISMDSFDDLTSVKGIEYFTELTSLELTNNPNLTAIDLTANTNITYLDLGGCGLTELDVSMLPALEKLWCNNNPLTRLTLGTQPALKLLHCYGTGGERKDEPSVLPELDISGCPYLLDAYRNGTMSEPDGGILYESPQGGILFVDAGTKIVTGALEVKFNHSCTFGNNLSINYYIPQSYLEGYSNFALHLEKEEYDATGANVTTVSYDMTQYEPTTVNGTPMVCFRFRNVASYEIGNVIYATLSAEKDGVTYQSAVDEYSAKQYAFNRLEKSTDLVFKKLLVDMLNYGACAQTYFNYNTSHPVNAELTAAQQALGTQTDPVPTSAEAMITTPGATAQFYGKSVVFNSNMELKYYMTFDTGAPADTVKLRLSYTSVDGTQYDIEIPASQFTYVSSYNAYSAKLTSIMAMDISAVVRAGIYDGDTLISDLMDYSLETYCYNRLLKSTDETFKTLLRAVMKYGKSAEEYFIK